jgi:hypothetical protein
VQSPDGFESITIASKGVSFERPTSSAEQLSGYGSVNHHPERC